MSKASDEEIKVDEHLTLRQLREDEAEQLFNLTKKNHEYLKPWMPWLAGVKTVEDSASFIRAIIQKREKDVRYGYGMIYGGKVAGHMSIMHLNDEQHPEIGYWLDHELNGKGLTTKAVMALTDFGLNKLKLPKILIKAKPENIASNRVAEKCGYTLVETKDYPGRGPLCVWAITRTEID